MALHDCTCGGMSENCPRCGGTGMVAASSETGGVDTTLRRGVPLSRATSDFVRSGFLRDEIFVRSPTASKQTHGLPGLRYKPKIAPTRRKVFKRRWRKKRKRTKTLSAAVAEVRPRGPGIRDLVPCTDCPSLVRRDRLEKHLWRVHSVREAVRQPPRRVQVSENASRNGNTNEAAVTPDCPTGKTPRRKPRRRKAWEKVQADSESIAHYLQQCYSRPHRRYVCEFCGAMFLKSVGLRLHFHYCDDVPITLIATFMDARSKK